MSEGYRSDLAAAQARITELEGRLAARAASPDLAAAEAQHAKLLRAVPKKANVWLITGLAVLVAVASLGPMLLFPVSPYDHYPRLADAARLTTTFAMVFAAVMQWIARSEGLQKVALSERLLAAERDRAALADARVRVAPSTQPTRVAPDEELEETETAGSSPKASA